MCVLVGIGVVAFWPGEREPVYQGKKLSEWLRAYALAEAELDRTADYGLNSYRGDPWDTLRVPAEAVQHIGTNAVPFLLKWIQYEQPWWRKKAYIYYSKLPSRMQTRSITWWIWGAEPYARKNRAINAFRILGARADDAVADLYFLALNPRTSQAAFECLEGIGYPAVPVLNRLTDAPDEKVRAMAYHTLSGIGR